MEWNDITYVDKDDRAIGSGTEDNAIAQGIVHRVVRVFVRDIDGNILLQKRGPNVDIPNKWDQSAAGHVDAGEEYNAAARRELEEEVGITGKTLRMIDHYYSEEDDDGVLRKRFNKLYDVETDTTDTSRQESEVSEVLWVSEAELKRWLRDSPFDFTQGCREALSRYFSYLDNERQK